MKTPCNAMTNRELYEEFREETGPRRYEALSEMARRLRRVMITEDVVPVFKQYKLNGAGMQRW